MTEFKEAIPESLRQSICKKCQACCTYLVIEVKVGHATDIALEFYRTRGIRTTQPLFGKMSLLIPHRCPYLGPTGCSIYESRPEACRVYDASNDPFLKKLCKLRNVTIQST